MRNVRIMVKLFLSLNGAKKIPAKDPRLSIKTAVIALTQGFHPSSLDDVFVVEVLQAPLSTCCTRDGHMVLNCALLIPVDAFTECILRRFSGVKHFPVTFPVAFPVEAARLFLRCDWSETTHSSSVPTDLRFRWSCPWWSSCVAAVFGSFRSQAFS